MASKELKQEPLAPGAGDLEGGSPSEGAAGSNGGGGGDSTTVTSVDNKGDSVMEFNVINFSTPQGRQILHDIGEWW